MPAHKRPLIGITVPDRSERFARLALGVAVFLGGGTPVYLSAEKPKWNVKIEGLVIGGGTDIFPLIYQFNAMPDYIYDHERDKMELAWLARTEAQRRPILGICRGAQMMNVHRGGTLHLQVSEAYDDSAYPSHLLAKIFYRKYITIDPGTLIHRILRRQATRVNSLHKQAIHQIGDNLRDSARERNGVIQAIEDIRPGLFFLGVQFHPEYLIYRRCFRRLFSALVAASRQARS